MAKPTKKRAAGRKQDGRETASPREGTDASASATPTESDDAADAVDAKSGEDDNNTADAASDDASGDSAAAPDKVAVKRTPVRAAGSVQDTNREVALGLLTGLLVFSLGAYAVYWSIMRWMLRGGSATLMAVSLLLPVSVPIIIGSILGERGRKAFGYAMIGGVMVGTLISAMYLSTRLSDESRPSSPSQTLAPPSVGPASR